MVTIRLKGEVTADGQLQCDLPENPPPEDVQITIEIPETSDDFSDDEIAELLNFTPTSGAQVVAAGLTGGWEAKGITDPVTWIEEQRRKQRERRQW